MNILSSALTLLLLPALGHAQGFAYEQPMSPGGGVLRNSQLWIDPSGQNDSDNDALAWEDFEFPVSATISKLRWWGQAAPSLGFEISFFHQDPNTIAVQPDIFAPGSHPISEHIYTSFSQIAAGPGLFQFELDLVQPLTFDANTRYFVSVVGRTPIFSGSWGWAQGTGGVHGTFWWLRGAHMYFHLGDDRAVSLATDAGWPIGVAFGFGDGSGGTCPCGNVGSAGAGCANSTGLGARLQAFGSASLGNDDLFLQGSQLPAGQPTLAFCGADALNGGFGLPFGDGLRCAGGANVVRLGIAIPDTNGRAHYGPGLASVGGWSPGQTRRFQLWYRDPLGSPCGSGFNLSNGIELSLVQ